MSAVSLGYLEDPFAALFISDTQARRFPIINRGMEAFHSVSR
jgi:[phosphatase 2A protein]-leucine-carboxy methyltransferase